MTYRSKLTRWIAPLVLALSTATAQNAQAFEARTGFDLLQDPATTISGLHSLYIGQEIAPDLTFGMSLYSAATGDAGGAFFWGYEIAKRVPLRDRIALTFSGFIGGGGGAAQVNGDGLMTRANVGLAFGFGEKSSFNLGVSWIKISGAPINGAALSFGVAHNFGSKKTTQNTLDLPLRAISLRMSGYSFPNSLTRSGGAQPNLALVGAEASFALRPKTDLFVAADGAAQGGEGYMQVLAGLRQHFALGPMSLFAEGSIGFGGGGDVNTGGGILGNVGVGIAVPIASWGDIELVLGKSIALDGDASGLGATVRLTRVFGRNGKSSGTLQNWQFSTGLSLQSPNATFRNPGATKSGSPIMVETSVDLFLGKDFYITGNAQTTVDGNVGGYAIGLIGAGYRFPIGQKWALSLEGHIGAAGGGGVNAQGGPVVGLRAEVDYKLSDKLFISTGFGKLQSVNSGGMAPTIFQIGVKMPFSTL